MPPEIRTERLVLREWRSEDFTGFVEMAGDVEVGRYIGGAVTPAQAWRQMAMHAGHWSLRGYGNWAVATPDGEFLGRAGFWHPQGWPGVELGWAFRRAAWSQGLATESARAALSWCWDNSAAEEVVSFIHPDNHASARVAAKLGFVAGARLQRVNGGEVIVHRLARPAAALGDER